LRTVGNNHVFTQTDAVSTMTRMAGGNLRWTDQMVEARVQFLSTPGRIQIGARFSDATDYYYVETTTAGLKIRKRSAAASTDLATSIAGTPYVIGRWYRVALAVQGTTLTAYLDGVPVVSVADTTAPLLSGGIMLGTAGCAAAFDDVKVTLP
jgi:hypothetical protein